MILSDGDCVDSTSGASFDESREEIDAVPSSVRGVTDSNW